MTTTNACERAWRGPASIRKTVAVNIYHHLLSVHGHGNDLSDSGAETTAGLPSPLQGLGLSRETKDRPVEVEVSNIAYAYVQTFRKLSPFT